MKDPAFGEDAVRALATAESFARDRYYARSGAISRLVRRGARLTAQVEGSDFAPYEVMVDLHHGAVAGTRCSCPYDWGGACTHVVAVLLEYLDAPDAIMERPSLDGILRELDRETLAALLKWESDTRSFHHPTVGHEGAGSSHRRSGSSRSEKTGIMMHLGFASPPTIRDSKSRACLSM